MENNLESLLLADVSLHVDEVKQTLKPVVEPVTLQQKFISILQPSNANPGLDNLACATTTAVPVSSSTTTVTSSSSSTTSVATVANVNLVSSLITVTTVPLVTTMLQIERSVAATPQATNSNVAGERQQEVSSALPTKRHDKDIQEAVSTVSSRNSSPCRRKDAQRDSYPANKESGASSSFSREVFRNEQDKEVDGEPGKPRAQISDVTPKRDVMQFFRDQEKSLQENFSSMPQKVQQVRRRVLVHKQAAGLEHLDNLIHLMEQLTSLKDENSRLRQRCDYLESTRTLLQAKKELACKDISTSLGFMTPPFSHKQPHHHRHQQRTENLLVTEVPRERGLTKHKLPSPKYPEYLRFTESSSDQETSTSKLSIHNRSFSAESLEFLSEKTSDDRKTDNRKKVKAHEERHHSKQTAKSSKWTRVKKALIGHKFHEDLGVTERTIPDQGQVSHTPYSINSTTGSPKVPESSSSRISGSSLGREITPVTLEMKNSSHRDQMPEDPDLTSEVWMGPPDWWEEYESRKEGRVTSTNNEATSTIEVETVYLGSKLDPTTSTATVVSTFTTSQDKYLSTDDSLPHGQSSPSLSRKETTAETIISKDLRTNVDNTGTLHNSSNCKSTDVDISTKNEMRLERKPPRSAWGRVKDIIHTRKDSIKRKLKRDKVGLDSEDVHKIDTEAPLEEGMSLDTEGDVLLIRPHKTLTTGNRQQKISQPPLKNAAGKSHISRASVNNSGSSPGNVDMAAILAGNISLEFSKKMHEWEKMKSKRSLAPDESDLGSLDLPRIPQQLPICTIHLRDLKGKVPDSATEGATTEESNTSMEVLGAPSISVEDSQKRTTGSHSRKMQEWDSQIFKDGQGTVKDSSPVREREGSRRKRGDRQKNKTSKEDKDKKKLDQQKEERYNVKLEKDQIRGEKNRVRALEFEEKLEKLSGTLNTAASVINVQQTTHVAVTGETCESFHKQGNVSYNLDLVNTTEGGDPASRPPTLTNQSHWDSPDDSSATESSSEASHGEKETCGTDKPNCQTKSNIATLERANTQLLENLHKKEIEYAAVQEEVQEVNEKLAKVRQDHAAEMEQFHSDLAKGKFAGPVKLEVGELEATVGQLEETIKTMENFGEKLASSMESAAIGKWQSIEAEETIHKQLLELIEQMRGMLVRASQTEEYIQKTMALSTFETFYGQAMKLQVQMNNLRLSHLERNREILVIKRQLLLQEVNNLLLQADITRKETELYQFQEAKRFASIKRWNTFGGSGRQRPQVQKERPPSAKELAYLKARPQKEVRPRQGETPRISIPYTPEEIMPESSPTSYNSIPAMSLGTDASGESLAESSKATLDQLFANHGAAREQSTEHTGTHCELFLDKRDKHVNLLLGPYLGQQRDNNDVKLLQDDQEHTTSQKLQKSFNHVQSTKHPTEQSSFISTVSPQVLIESFQPKSPRELVNESTDDNLPSLPGEAPSKSSVIKISSKRVSSKPTFTTLCDSAPLHREIAELRRVKRKVEKSASTVKMEEIEKSSVDTSSENGLNHRGSTKVFDQERQQTDKHQSSFEPALEVNVPLVNGYPPISPEVESLETSHTVKSTDIPTGSELRDVETLTDKPPLPGKPTQSLPSINGQNISASKSSPSPVCKRRLSQQKQERESELKDYYSISPISSPATARGKPPLPRQTTPARISPSASPCTRKGPRAKSLGDMNREDPEAVSSKPLQEVVGRFDKRATVYETNTRPFDQRKTPSPTLHLPRVGLVSRVRRLKPATELIEESQRYRSGQSIYTIRILQRYFPTDNKQSSTSDHLQNRERQTDLHAHKLSRETTPAPSTGSSRTNSNLSLQRSDSVPRQRQFISNISKTGTNKSSAPNLNDQRQVKIQPQTLGGPTENACPETHLWDHDSDIPSSSAIRSQHRKSCENSELFTPVTPTSENSFQTMSSPSLLSENLGAQRQDSVLKAIIHKSLPTFGSAAFDELTILDPDKRASEAAYSVSLTDKQQQSRQFNNIRSQPSSTPSSPGPRQPGEQIRKHKWKSEKLSREKRDPFRLLPCPSPDRRRKMGRNNAETIRTLCEQAISFDLGLSRELQTEVVSRHTDYDIQTTSTRQDAAAALSATMTESIRPLSSSSVGEAIPTSPTTTEKKKSNKFLESNWLQKSKKFFKLSN